MKQQLNSQGRRRWILHLPLLAALLVTTAGIGLAQEEVATSTPPTTSPNHPGVYGQMRSTTMAERLAARLRGPRQKTGVNKVFAGVNQKTAAYSPLGWRHTKLGQLPQAAMNPGGIPDYFGIGNYANSPLPTVGPGPITGVRILTGGGGYQNPVVTVTDTLPGTGSGAVITATATAGVVTSLTVVNGGTGYSNPVLAISDPNGISAGATAIVTSFGTLTGGIRKFVDTLPGLTPAGANDLGTYIPIAVPDTTSYPGDDYYKIGLREYTHQFHRDLPGPCAELTPGVLTCGGATPATNLRGYYDLNNPADSANHYLGPLIIAQKNRPARVLFQNNLTTDLNLPYDPTYMGAGMVSDGTNSMMASQKRADLHLHGGNSPWISDGTTMQWTTPAGGDGQPAALGFSKGFSFQNVPDMIGPGLTPGGAPMPILAPSLTDGQGTYYWTNQQSGRLLFYHDHAYGITRINVYDGEAAGYLIVDPTEEDALLAGTAPGTLPSPVFANPAAPNFAAADLAHLIPLVIQDKTFVPDSGVAGGQLSAQDPTWNVAAWGGAGSLWFPHVYTPNQNPADPGGANAFGRWDWGPWFWPPQNPTTLLMQPYQCPGYPVGVMCPGVPNISSTPEAFMDTPVVNGTAYPTKVVDPAAYRFQALSAGNDRAFHLSFFYAVDKNGAVCRGGNVFDAATCTEVAMVPAIPHTSIMTPPLCSVATTFPPNGGLVTGIVDPVTGLPLNGTGLPANCWPTSWPTDSRPEGVPDPLTAGPAIVQIGTESGLLPAPVVIPPTPIGYEYNRRSITVLNVFTHSLLLGPAERADFIVDFSSVPVGSILLLYNDAPAPVPAFDPRIDYFTNDGDQTLAGGAPSTQRGYGPNTRTVMQFQVTGTGANNGFSVASLSAQFPGAWNTFQHLPVVPETTNGGTVDTYSHIFDTSLTFTPFGAAAPVTQPLLPKALHELFTTDYGRMNSLLAMELPLTNWLTQTTIPLAYIDPPTEYEQQGVPALWKVTHNGVDTHFIHFHLFDVQVINRVGWDGTIKPPDANEVGWKDTVRMNPLEDIIVAMRPEGQVLPWPLPDSIRPLDVTMPVGTTTQFTGINPVTNNPVTVTNDFQNFGYEYVWHCHILGHEENDMMRPVVYMPPPGAPTNLVAVAGGSGVTLTFTDNSANESSFNLQRDIDPLFPAPTEIPVPASVPNTAYGGVITFLDATAGTGAWYYRVQAVNNNFQPPLAQTFNAQPATLSAWSNVASTTTAPFAAIAPTALVFGNQPLNTTSAMQTATLSNNGSVALGITGITLTGANPADFALPVTGTPCGASLAAGASCLIGVTFTPTVVGARAASVTITTNDPAHLTLTVTLTGTGTTPIAGVAPTLLAFPNQLINTTSAPMTATLSNTGNIALSITSISLTGTNPGDFGLTNPCGTSVAAGGSCILSVTFTPTVAAARSAAITIVSNDPVNPTLTVNLTGTGITAPKAVVTPTSLVFATRLVNTTSTAQTATLSNTGSQTLNISSLSLTGANPGEFILNNGCGATLGVGLSCPINVAFRPTASGLRTAAVTIVSNDPVNPTLTVTLSGMGTALAVSPTTLAFGNQAIGVRSGSRSVFFRNYGTTAIAFTGFTITGTNAGEFYISGNSCTASLAAGAGCSVAIRFLPLSAGAKAAQLNAFSSDPSSPSIALLTGTGVNTPIVSLSTTGIGFGQVKVGTTSAARNVTLTNTGTAALLIASISFTGTNPADFVQTNNCPIGGTGLAPGASCTVAVSFKPLSIGYKTANLSFTDNASGSPQRVRVTGTGY